MIPTRSDIAVPKKSASLLLGNQSINGVTSSLRAWNPNLNFQSEMSSALISPEMVQLANHIANLQSPLSPASLPYASNEMAIEERLFDATASVKMLASQVAMYMDKKWRDKLFSQIDSLHDLDEWDTDDKPVKKSSFATFLKAILQIKPQRHPGLGLTYDGCLIAAWTTGQDRLTAEFLPKDRVRWILSRRIEGEVERATGETLVSRLYECLIPYHPDHWFQHEKN